MAAAGFQFTVLTANPALRNVFEMKAVEVIFIDINVPRLRDLLNPWKLSKFYAKKNKIVADLRLKNFKKIILTVNGIDILIIDVAIAGFLKNAEFYFLPEFGANNISRCSVFSMNIREKLEHLKRKFLYHVRTYVGENSGGRHAYVDLEKVLPNIKSVKAQALIGKKKEINLNPQCIFIASYSYDEDEAYFGNKDFAEVLRILTEQTNVQYKIHPGSASLRSHRFENHGLTPLLSELPIEELASPADLVIGNDSTALPRLSVSGVTVVSISHMDYRDTKKPMYSAERKSYLKDLQDECDGAILTPRNFEELIKIILDWKNTNVLRKPASFNNFLTMKHRNAKK